jgi:hypothetical protein
MRGAETAIFLYGYLQEPRWRRLRRPPDAVAERAGLPVGAFGRGRTSLNHAPRRAFLYVC